VADARRSSKHALDDRAFRRRDIDERDIDER
jgi:hypothetical protein